MSGLPEVRLRNTRMGEWSVTVDGTEIGSAIRRSGMRLDVPANPAEIPTLTVDLMLFPPNEVDLGRVKVEVPDATRDALIALGWTPPGGKA